MRKHNALGLALIVLVLALILGSVSSMASANLATTADGEVIAVDVRSAGEAYGVNAYGMTYGSAMDAEPDEEPDLILARGIDGTVGYIKASDYNPPDFKSPEEALEWQNNVGYPETIPLYAEDGVTVIGAFKIG